MERGSYDCKSSLYFSIIDLLQWRLTWFCSLKLLFHRSRSVVWSVFVGRVDSSVLLKDSWILVVVISRLLVLLLLLLLRLGPSLFIFHSSIWLHLLFCRTLITLFIFFLYLCLSEVQCKYKLENFQICNNQFCISNYPLAERNNQETFKVRVWRKKLVCMHNSETCTRNNE